MSEQNSGDSFTNAAVEEEEARGSNSQALDTMGNDFRSALDEFRNDWKRELKQSPNAPVDSGADVSTGKNDNVQGSLAQADEDSDGHALAQSLFYKAVELEKHGKVYDALPYYRKAVQLIPDIEFRIYEKQQNSAQTTSNSTAQEPSLGQHKSESATKAETDEVEDDVDSDDLYEKFQLDLQQEQYQGKLILSSRDPSVISTQSMHISDLPPEILMYIFRWVVSSQLDMRSLEQCAAVCKGFYICARAESIWHLACQRVWDLDCCRENYKPKTNEIVPALPRDSNHNDDTSCSYASWRLMFTLHPRVLFHGCYISKTTYIRMGENSFQDQFYRPIQLVEYYRYLRFMGDGTCLMMTSSDEPAQGVSKLRNPYQWRPDVLRGKYYLFGNTVAIILKKYSQKQANQQRYGSRQRHIVDSDDFKGVKYCVDFRIMNTPKRRCVQLAWLRYSMEQTSSNRHASSSDFDLTPSKYPPLWFSPVRSYLLDAEEPL